MRDRGWKITYDWVVEPEAEPRVDYTGVRYQSGVIGVAFGTHFDWLGPLVLLSYVEAAWGFDAEGRLMDVAVRKTSLE